MSTTLHLDIKTVDDAQELYDGLVSVVERQKVVCDLNIKVKYVALRCRIVGYYLDAIIMEDMQRHIENKESTYIVTEDGEQIFKNGKSLIPF
jgi:hypothetical protein